MFRGTRVMDIEQVGKIACREIKKYIYCSNYSPVMDLLHSYVHIDNYTIMGIGKWYQLVF